MKDTLQWIKEKGRLHGGGMCAKKADEALDAMNDIMLKAREEFL